MKTHLCDKVSVYSMWCFVCKVKFFAWFSICESRYIPNKNLGLTQELTCFHG